MAMNTFDARQTWTLGQVEVYLLFSLALAGAIVKALEALTHTSGNAR
jgi:hypothetical protein